MLENAFDLFHRGGPVMWPILICSLLGICVSVERLLVSFRYQMAQFFFRKQQEQIIALTREGKFDEALGIARKAESAVCGIFARALENRETGLQETLEAASQQTLDDLRRGFSVLDTIITVAPMLGILGTVTGIIKTFHLLSAAGIENPAGATAGISEALITTAAGLIVAIVCLFPFNFLVSQLKRRTHELEQMMHLFELAYKTGFAKNPKNPLHPPYES